jgi:glycosyltransferase involved in cell wall biosynthesis
MSGNKKKSKKTLKILILTQWFEPEPAFKGLSFAKELKRRGYEVEVLTGFPNYPYGKLYKGYKLKFFKKEKIDGVFVNRVYLYPNHDSSSFKRVFNYLSFAVSASCLGPFLIKKPDIVYVYHPPATVGLPAIVLKKIFHCKIIYDVQDLWPDTLSSTGMLNNKSILKTVGLWCSYIYKKADKILVLSNGFYQKLKERGVPESKLNVVYNWFEADNNLSGNIDPELSSLLKNNFSIVYAGNIGKAQSLGIMLKAAEKVLFDRKDWHFFIIGEGVEKKELEKIKREKKLFNLTFVDQVSKSDIVKIFSLSDILFLHLKNTSLFKITVPSKVQAYLAAGKPIVAGLTGDGAEILINSRAALLFNPDSEEDLIDKLEEIYMLNEDERIKMGLLGYSFFEKNFSFNKCMDIFEKIILE